MNIKEECPPCLPASLPPSSPPSLQPSLLLRNVLSPPPTRCQSNHWLLAQSTPRVFRLSVLRSSRTLAGPFLALGSGTRWSGQVVEVFKVWRQTTTTTTGKEGLWTLSQRAEGRRSSERGKERKRAEERRRGGKEGGWEGRREGGEGQEEGRECI